MTASVQNRARTPIQLVAAIIGIVFLVVGILGFIPGITTGFSTLSFAGLDSHAFLIGLFQVSVLHNFVHLLYGIAGLIFARTAGQARSYLIWGGIIYLVLFVYGLIAGGASSANFVPLNAADNVLHLILGAGMVVLGVVLSRRAVPAAA